MTTELSIEDEMRDLLKGKPEDEGDALPEEIVETPEETTEEAPQETPSEEVEAIEPPPPSFSAQIKEKWKDLPPDVRAELVKRENDVHQMFTRHDGELNLGRKMKDVITPYMSIIQAEGGTPEGAVKDLLNTAYVLRTASPEQKRDLLLQVAQQYGVDLGVQQQSPNDAFVMMQRELAQIKQMANPEFIKSQLQEQMEHDKIISEVKAFAENPANKYFEQVKPLMAPILASGQAKDIQEAYDKACYADPTIRSTLISEQTKELEAKRKAEIAAKKQAAASVTGSPELASPSTRATQKTLEDELRDSFRASKGVIN